MRACDIRTCLLTLLLVAGLPIAASVIAFMR